MKKIPGELRFCEDCIHRTKVNGLQNNEIRCERLGLQLQIGSEADQCLYSNDFEETPVAKEVRKNFYVGSFDDILLS